MELTIEQALQQGITEHNVGNLQEAERVYRAILQSQPKHPDASHNLGLIAISVNQIEAALPLFKTALNVNPNIEQFWVSYIDALVKAKRLKDAKQAIKKAKKKGFNTKKLDTLLSQSKGVTDNKVPSQELLNSLLEHYQNGRFSDAEKLATAINQEFPSDNFSWKILGEVFKSTGRNFEAVNASQTAVALSPQDAEAHNNLGVTLLELGRLDEAVASFEQAIALKPDYAQAHNNLGVRLLELGRLDEAEASYTQAIALEPDYAEAHSNLGNTLQILGRLDEALASYTHAIVLDPENSSAKHMLAALTGETTKTAPRDYVEKLFDNYAAMFDSSLVDNLEYQIPKVIAEMIIKDSEFDSLGTITDLGCGTGLFGVEINQFCAHLEGVDLSAKMLDKAKGKSIYSKLVKQDIVDYLSNASLNFDYFVSTDVFIYIGDLSDVFRLIKSRNKIGGKLAFSTEDYDGDDFFLEQSGRYSHSKKYIEGLCEKFGYQLSHFETQALRKEKNQYIRGGLYILEF